MDDALAAVLVLLSRHLELPPAIRHVYSSPSAPTGQKGGGRQAHAMFDLICRMICYGVGLGSLLFRPVFDENLESARRQVDRLQRN